MATSVHALPPPPFSASSPRSIPVRDLELDLSSQIKQLSTLDPPGEASTPDHWIPRDPSLVRLTGKHPFNCEPPLPLLMRHGFITPSHLHYVRNHGHVPRSTIPSSWTVEVTGLVPRPTLFTVEDIVFRFPPRELPVTLVCAGNRRREQNLVKQTVGFNWGPGGVSTAVWRGTMLCDVLHACGMEGREEGWRGWHVWFEGEEELPGGGGSKYGTSIGMEVAMDRARDVILAYGMNGGELPPDHGYPLRVIIPGHIGGRMVKWLRKVVVAREESPNYYHYKDNRVLPSHVDAELADAEGWWYKPEYIINELNINSVITTPSHDEMLPINASTLQGPYILRGYAYSGGGRKVTRVEVTLDCGDTWRLCDLDHPEKPTKFGKYWCWCFWSIHVDVPDLLGAKEIAVRAWDQSLNTQPEKLTWNVMGMLNNCWFRVKINTCRPQRGEVGLVFDHPTVPGNALGGWMTRQKHLDSSSNTAHILKKSRSAPFVSTPAKLYTMSDVHCHSSRDSAWITVHGRVYDCTNFLKDHPGGADSILINAGTDCTEEFDAIHSDKARALLESYCIGELSASDSTTIASIPRAADALGRPVALSSRDKIQCTLVYKVSLSHNVRRFRFALPSSHQVLGLPVGKHVFLAANLSGKLCMRAYTPTSPADEVGHFDLVVKIYDKGLMSQHLDALPPGSTIDVKGPFGHVEYLGRGEFTVHGERMHARRVVMVAGGTGITPVYQIMQAAAGDSGDDVEIRLVYTNRTEADVLLREELDGIVEGSGDGRVKVWYMVGAMTEEQLREHVPHESSCEMLVLVCGPPGMVTAVQEALARMGYDKGSVIVF